MMAIQERPETRNVTADQCPLLVAWFDVTCATFEADIDEKAFVEAQLPAHLVSGPQIAASNG